jgi:predicted DNA-binding transcriptional regulator AlpA
MIPELDAVLQLARQLHAEQLPEFVGELETIRATAWSRLTAPGQSRAPAEDELVDIEEASRRLGMSRSYLYRNSSLLPFSRRVGRSLRFSAQGIDYYIRRKRVLTPTR